MTTTHDRPGRPDPVERLDDLGAALAAAPPSSPTPLAQLHHRAARTRRRRAGGLTAAVLVIVAVIATTLLWTEDGTGTLDTVGPDPTTTTPPPPEPPSPVTARLDPSTLSAGQAAEAALALTVATTTTISVDPTALLVERWDGTSWTPIHDVVAGQASEGQGYRVWVAPGTVAPGSDVQPELVLGGFDLVANVVLPGGEQPRPAWLAPAASLRTTPLDPGWYRLSLGVLPLDDAPVDGPPWPDLPRAAAHLHVTGDDDAAAGRDTAAAPPTATEPTGVGDDPVGCAPIDIACLCAQQEDRWAEGTDLVAVLLPQATDQQQAALEVWLSELEASPTGTLELLAVQTREEAYAELERTFVDQPELVESLTPADLPRTYQLAVHGPGTPAKAAQWLGSGPVGFPTVQAIIVGQPDGPCATAG